VPTGEVVLDGLKDMAGANAGHAAAPCEAGCYQCLLSYYNQPDHEIINRRNPEAVTFLAALANSTVQPLRPVVEPAKTASGDASTPIEEWLSALSRHGLRQPDQVNLPINGGEATADALYQTARALVFLAPPSSAVSAYAQDRGFTVITFPPDATAWPEVFAAHPSIFGNPSSPT
jgi:hypothetical protein